MYVGSWIRVNKPISSDEQLSRGIRPRTLIHDDDAARALGFKAGIVGGLTLFSVTTGAIAASFGHTWYEGGIYSVRHKNASYEGEVRVVWEIVPPDPPDRRKIAFHLENREGDTSTYGWASMAKANTKPVPPWERNPAVRVSAGADADPEVIVGTTRKPFELIVHREDVMESDQNWWYRIASPWGDPILSPRDIASVFYHGRRINPAFVEPEGNAPVRASMDAGTDVTVYEPVFLDHIYVIHTKLADKWRTEKTAFTSTEYTFEDKKTGKSVAAVRNYGARMIRELATKPVVQG